MTSNLPLQGNRGMANAIGASGAALGRNVPGSPGILCVLGPYFYLKTISQGNQHFFFSFLIHQFIISIRTGTLSYCLGNQISS